MLILWSIETQCEYVSTPEQAAMFFDSSLQGKMHRKNRDHLQINAANYLRPAWVEIVKL
jgi:hypothetical protein